MKGTLIFLLIVSVAANVLAQKTEAENGTLTGTTKGTSHAGYSGTGYVTSFDEDNDAASMQIQITDEGLYDLWVGYSTPYGEKINDVYVNGVFTGQLQLPEVAGFTEALFGKVFLNSGGNTVKIVKNWGWFELDYVRAAPASAFDFDHIAGALVTPEPSHEADVLYQYLSDIYGKKIISGQQCDYGNDEPAEHIEDLSGKVPAIKGFDLIDYSPSRAEHGTESHDTERIIAWWNAGGIPTSCWHWNAPKDLLDTSEEPWWKGFYTEATTFDVSIAMSDENSEEYALIIRDLDAIADQLKIIRDAHVPLLWRPLHEAEGGWFWWGAKGPDACQWLWHLMYDRFTNVHGLNNLIWVWTGTASEAAPDWYPGDEYVDIIGTDIYLNDKNYSASFSMFDKMAQLHEGHKIITMSENGTIPDPTALDSEGARWSWFCTWSGGFILNGTTNEPSHITSVYSDDYVITMDELPDFDDYQGLPDDDDDVTTAVEVPHTSVTIAPNPFSEVLRVSFNNRELPQRIILFNPLGQALQVLDSAEIRDVTLFDGRNLSQGMYFLQIIGRHGGRTFKVVRK